MRSCIYMLVVSILSLFIQFLDKILELFWMKCGIYFFFISLNKLFNPSHSWYIYPYSVGLQWNQLLRNTDCTETNTTQAYCNLTHLLSSINSMHTNTSDTSCFNHQYSKEKPHGFSNLTLRSTKCNSSSLYSQTCSCGHLY